MPFQDSELDRLARDRDQAKRNLDSARHDLDMARGNLERMRSMYGPKLDYLKSAIPDTKANMKAAFDQASSSWEAGQKSAAKDWSDKGKQLQAEKQAMYTEKEECVVQLRAANEAFHAALAAYHTAKGEHETDRDTYFARLNYLKEEAAKERTRQEGERRKREERKLKREANRQQFIDWAKSIFVLKELERYQAEREKQARGYTDEKGKERRHQAQVQARTENCTVKVNYGYDRDHDVFTTDIYVFQHGIDEHLHLGVDEDGNELFRKWRPND